MSHDPITIPKSMIEAIWRVAGRIERHYKSIGDRRRATVRNLRIGGIPIRVLPRQRKPYEKAFAVRSPKLISVAPLVAEGNYLVDRLVRVAHSLCHEVAHILDETPRTPKEISTVFAVLASGSTRKDYRSYARLSSEVRAEMTAIRYVTIPILVRYDLEKLRKWSSGNGRMPRLLSANDYVSEWPESLKKKVKKEALRALDIAPSSG